MPGAEARELHVRAGQDLRGVLAGALPGDVIRVDPGTYSGNLVLNTSRVTLLGEGRPTLDGKGRGTVLLIRGRHVVLRGFHIANSGTSVFNEDAGVKLVGTTGGRIEDNVLDGVFYGIHLARSRDNAIHHNRLVGSAPPTTMQGWGDGIRLWNSPGNEVTNNTVSRFRDGLYLEFSNNTRVEHNDATENRRYGLHFMFMNGSYFHGNRFLRNQVGSVLMYSRNIRVEDNVFEGCRGPVGQGVMFKDNDDSLLVGNRIVDNTVGLFIDGSNRNRFVGNLVAGNGWGLLLFSSSADNVFSGNTFYANSYQVAVDIPRSHNHLAEGKRGNYWSDYRGYDLDGDGRGDVPHAPVSMFSFLAMQYPDLYAFAGSPAVQALAFAQRVLPALSPSQLRDEYPLMAPVREATRRGMR